jgi:hypothetical protein
MQQTILAQGFFPLTEEAADAALDAIDFIAAAVRGYDAIDVTDVVRPIWRAHLAYWYPQLPPLTQQWYANAPLLLASIRARWPLLYPGQRAATLQMWAMDLPHMLWMVDPVLAEAQEREMDQSQRSQLDDLRAAARQPAMTEADAVNALNRERENTTNLQNFATQMTANTLDLMRAINSSS